MEPSNELHQGGYEIVNHEEFVIAGISINTTGENGESMKDVEKLWTEFWKDTLKTKLPEGQRLDNTIYAVYTNYVSDMTKEFTLIIGYKVPKSFEPTMGLKMVHVPQSNYAKFNSKGKMPDAVVDTWMEISTNQIIDRAYTTDFTIHDDKYFKEEAEVDTFISLKQ